MNDQKEKSEAFDQADKGSIIVFAPHPDDEVIACGGTILKRRAEGYVVHICFATDGSQSHKAVLGLDVPSAQDLIRIRKVEALCAAAKLGVESALVTFVGARDTRLIDGLNQLERTISSLFSAIPDICEIFIPHERRELNADHILTGRTVLEQIVKSGINPVIYKYVVWNAEIEASFGYANRQAVPEIDETQEVCIAEDIGEYLEQKYEAFLEHKTQTTLFVPEQQRTVVPPLLLEQVRSNKFEEFWVVRQ
ncbi:MAG: hypothetical protein HC843_07960 [Sphingomonadales bacterium]|nr:hypothetical protein [Sphingomonadales bacterium]